MCVPKPLIGGFECDELVLYGIRVLAQATLWSSRPMRVEFRWTSTNESGGHWAELYICSCSTIRPTVCKQQSAVKSARLGHWHCQLPEGIYTKYKDIYVKNIIVGSNLFFCVFYKIPGRKWKMMIKSPEPIHQHIICWENYGWRLVLTYNLG